MVLFLLCFGGVEAEYSWMNFGGHNTSPQAWKTQHKPKEWRREEKCWNGTIKTTKKKYKMVKGIGELKLKSVVLKTLKNKKQNVD